MLRNFDQLLKCPPLRRGLSFALGCQGYLDAKTSGARSVPIGNCLILISLIFRNCAGRRDNVFEAEAKLFVFNYFELFDLGRPFSKELI